MGVRATMKANPVEVATSLTLGEQAKARRYKAQRRVDLYRDRSESVLRQQFLRIFSRSAAARRERAEAFLWLAQALSLFKRIVNEVAAPVYNPPPLRTITGGDAATFDALAKQMRLNGRMDLACRMLQACNRVLLHDRYVVSLQRVVRDVLTPNMYTAIYHPDDATQLLAVAYAQQVLVGGKYETAWVYWDDAEAFKFNARGAVTYVLPRAEHPGILPFVDIHIRERSCEDEDETSGDDLEAAHTAVQYILSTAIRLLHTQGHTQTGVNGDPANFPRDQILDSENPLFAGMGNTLTALWNPTTVDGHLKLGESITMGVAANYGLNRDRMNALANQASDTASMQERRAELVQVIGEAEQRAFEMLKVVSLSGALRLPVDATLKCDFPDSSAKVDRDKLLDIREKQRKQGLSSVVKDKLADAPDLGGDREKAKAEIEQDMNDEAWYIERRKALGISGDANAHQPGQTQEQNGANGPLVRDGLKSGDQAAAEAAAPLPAVERDHAAELATAQAALAAANRELERWAARLDRGVVDERQFEMAAADHRKARLAAEARLATLEREAEAEDARLRRVTELPGQARETVLALTEVPATLTPLQGKALFRAIVTRITVWPDAHFVVAFR